jgi:hypothetical protein
MDRVKMFSFLHAESQRPIETQHRGHVLDRYRNMIKAADWHCDSLQYWMFNDMPLSRW